MSTIGPGPDENRTSEASHPTQSSSSTRDRETNQWAMFIHFSILAGWIVPIGGLIVPIILWQLKKDELPGTVAHAHVVLNWIITSLVYAFICFILTFILSGIFGFIALGLATVIFAIVGGIYANN